MKVDGLKLKIQEVLGLEGVFISYKKNPLGSDLSFIYKNMDFEKSQNVKKELMALNYFEKIDFNGPYINLWLKESLIHLDNLNFEKMKMRDVRRIFQLSHRLKKEVNADEGRLDSYWLPLLKAYNLCAIDIHVLNEVSDDSIKALMKTFKALDLGYMYRKQSKTTLKGLLDLLEACLNLLEGGTYEHNL